MRKPSCYIFERDGRERLADGLVQRLSGAPPAFLTMFFILKNGVDASDKALDALERFFQGGEAELYLVQTHASGDLVVIERQHGRVGGLPDYDWSLRVTLVFRRDGAAWRLVYRHADPLVHGVSLEQLAALARG